MTHASSPKHKYEIILQPEQEKVLKLDINGTILVKGVAGSGKTTIALHRAKYLIDNYQELFSAHTVVIFTYNRLLSNYLNQIKKTVVTSYSPEAEAQKQKYPITASLNAYVTNFHKWAYKFMKNYDVKRCENMVTNSEKDRMIKTILTGNSTWSILSKPISFLSEEITWIKGKWIKSLDEYQNTPCAGRGNLTRLTQEQRKEIWALYEIYNKELINQNKADFDDYASICLEIIENAPDFSPPYTHIVIDEAQDLNKAQLLLIKKLVTPKTNSITIIADSAQRIYKSGFTWAEVGFNFKGKTCTLKRNYRSTIEIAKTALSLLNNDPQVEEFTQIETARRGEYIPIIYRTMSYANQWQYIKSELPHLQERYSNIAILVKGKQEIKQFSATLTQGSFQHTILTKDLELPTQNKGIYLCTISSAKGLEFDVVFIINCNDINFSYSFSDGERDEEKISTERRKLFTAMTRAREKLYMTTSDKNSSPFLDEIDSDLVQIIEDN